MLASLTKQLLGTTVVIPKFCPNIIQASKITSTAPVSQSQLVSPSEKIEDDAFGFTATDLINAKSYNEMPSPPYVPLLGNLFSFSPFGKFDVKDRKKCCTSMKTEYGPILRIRLPFIKDWSDFVEIMDPADFEIVMRNEGRYPIRPKDPTFELYFQERGGNEGLLLTNYEKWWQLRQPLNKFMMKSNAAIPYLENHNVIANDMIAIVRGLIRENNGKCTNLMEILGKWALESVCAIAYDTRVGSLDEGLEKGSWQNEFSDALDGIFTVSVKLIINPIEIFARRLGMKTKTFNDYIARFDMVIKTSKDLMEEFQKRAKHMDSEDLAKRFLPQLLSVDLPSETKVTLLYDMIFAGYETTRYTVFNNLFYLSKHPEVQEKLFQEIQSNVKEGEEITPTVLSRCHYLKAVVKEVFRVKPIVPLNARTLARDCVIKGYNVPKGTICILEYEYVATNEDNFADAARFYPERWLSKDDRGKPFSVLPFGFGPRMCIGRRFAEQEIYVGLLKLIQAFRFEHDDDYPLKGLGYDPKEKPVNFKIFER